jgi:cell division septum initiation protein DivIVA
MTNAPADREPFEIVRRGYEPQQVDRRIAALANDLQKATARRVELERQVEELRSQPEQGEQTTPYARLGARLEQILGLAEAEATELRDAAATEATQHRALTDQDADKIRKEAERYAQERHTDADTEAARVLQEAKRQADQLRDESERDAKARREEAEALFEHNRAKAAQAAADFETTLAHRRDQAERDFTQQMTAGEQQLAAITERSEQLRMEAEKLRSDSDRKSKRTMDEAARQADDLIAEAKAAAARIRGESERELSAATQRRDSINSQLTNVRQMLATLTGASLPDPIGDPAPNEGAPTATATDKPAGEKPVGEKPAVDKPVGEKPTAEGKDAQQAGSLTAEKPAHTSR